MVPGRRHGRQAGPGLTSSGFSGRQLAGAHALLRSLRSGALHPSFRTDADGFVETTIPLADARFRQPAPGSVAS